MRTRISAVLAVLGVLALPACGPQAPAATGSAADEQAIRDLATKYGAAYAARDTAALGALVTEDYEDVMPTGQHTQGRAAFQAALAQDMAMIPANVTLSMTATTTYVRWINANTAVAGGTWQVSPSMPGAPSKGSWMAVVAKRDSVWQMQSSLGSADMSAMMPPPDTTKKNP